MAIVHQLKSIYNKLHDYFGPQHWWPAETPFEVIVGAILTQNTAWPNVEKAIDNLKANKALEAGALYKMPQKKLGVLIRAAGYYNIKAKRLKGFLRFFVESYDADLKKMSRVRLSLLRRELLGVYGVGPETADSILLYALNKPSFVVDAYTRRIFSRHKLINDLDGYEQVRDLFMKNLLPNTGLFNEYHALIVKLGKTFCLKNKPRCAICPLR